jgi:hypothetical protein
MNWPTWRASTTWGTDGVVGALALDEGVLGRPLLGVEQVGHRLAFEVRQRVDAQAVGIVMSLGADRTSATSMSPMTLSLGPSR